MHGQAMIQRGIRIPAEDWEKLTKLATALDRKSLGSVTPSDLIREAVRKYLKGKRIAPR